MQVDLSGRCAIVTGSTRAIGRGIALALARNGAQVVVHGRTDAGVQRVVDEIASAGGTAFACAGDLADLATLDALVRTATSRGGRLDILVNNGAVTDTFAPFFEFSDARVDEILVVNLRASILLAQRAARVMATQGRGAIVNVTSVGGS